MIERVTALEQPELNCQTGVIGVKIAFLLIEDDKVIDSKWHRTAIPIDADPNQQMAALNANLAIMEPPMPQVSQADIDFIIQCHNLLKQRFQQQ